MFLLDTSFIVDIIRGKPDANTRLSKMASEKEEIIISAISVAELFEGAYGYIDTEKEIRKIRSFMIGVQCILFDDNIAEEYGRQRARSKKIGNECPIIDTMIGSTAIVKESTVITKNWVDFEKLEGIKIERFGEEKK
jgi:predicted nucleic acid-binding protein